MKYLIVGLGNIGDEYIETRHNTGFMVVDALANGANVFFEEQRYGFVANMKLKNQQLVLLKPSTFMNLSGNAVRYWLQKENISVENLLVVVDDLSLELGALRIKGKGSAGGHNGLKNIQELIGTENYARLRFGIGNDFPRGGQIDFVLSKFTEEKKELLNERIAVACDMIKSFCLAGLDNTMNLFNKR